MKRPTREQQSRQFYRFMISIGFDAALVEMAGKDDFREVTCRQIQQKYGNACLRLFLILFIRWRRGGRTLDGFAYKARYRLDPAVYRDLCEVLRFIEDVENPTASDVVQLMVQRGHEPKERVKIWDDKMNLVSADVYSGADIARVKAEKKAKRQAAREAKQLREADQ